MVFTRAYTLNSTELPFVAIVILNWNGCEETLACLEAIKGITYPRFYPIVVDNGSTDGSVARLRAAHPELEILETRRNLGYAGGNNVGITRALQMGADYVLVLNNDARLERESLSHAVEVAQLLGENAGVVGFATYSYEHPEVLQDFGLIEDSEEGAFYLHVPEESELAGKNFLPITSAHGCAMLLSRRLLEKIGLLDEDFFLMAEECDLCARARLAGFAVVGATRARVTHKGSIAFGGEQTPARIFYILRNRPLYVKKRLAEAGESDRFPRYLERYRVETSSLASQYLRAGQLRLAFASLVAFRAAEAERWGQRNLSLDLRLRALIDLIAVPIRGGARVTLRKLNLRAMFFV
jgi:GT2 family glycosyltransferase